MELLGSVQYRGKKIYLNRKKLLQSGRWKWIQEATGLDRGQEIAARNLLHERNVRELESHELRAVVIRGKGGAANPAEETVREFSKRWVENRKARELTSAFEDESRFRNHILAFIVDDVAKLGQSSPAALARSIVDATAPRLSSTLSDTSRWLRESSHFCL